MKRRLIPVLPKDSLLSMPTKQLMGRLHSLQRCEEAEAIADRIRMEIAAAKGILFKDSPQWRKAHNELKSVLATREHMPSAAERVEIRRQRARPRTEKKRNKPAGVRRQPLN